MDDDVGKMSQCVPLANLFRFGEMDTLFYEIQKKSWYLQKSRYRGIRNVNEKETSEVNHSSCVSPSKEYLA